MANAIVNSISFIGSVAEQATIQAQGIAGNLTFLLPNTSPIQGQLMTVNAISGNNVFLGWASSQSLSNIPLSALAQSGATTGQVIEWNGSAWVASTGVPGAGTVTSVALTAPVEFTVGGSPITTSGTLAITKANQSANTVWAGPTTGAAAAPTFRALVAADIGANVVTIAAINSKRGNGGFVQLAASGTAGAAGDVVTFDANGNTVDSAVLLSSLATTASLAAYALLTGAAFTGATSVTGAPLTLDFGAGNALIVSAGQAHFQGNVWVDGGHLLDSAASAGTSGQVLTSNGSSVVWSSSATLGSIAAASGGLAITSSGTDGIRIADNGNVRGILVGGTTAGAGHIWLWSPAGSTLLDVSDANVAVTGVFQIGGGSSRIKTTNPDVAGVVAFTGGSTAVYTFVHPYTGTNAPVVQITAQFDPTGAHADFWITFTGTSGNWTAFTVNNSTTQTGNIGYLVIDIG